MGRCGAQGGEAGNDLILISVHSSRCRNDELWNEVGCKRKWGGEQFQSCSSQARGDEATNWSGMVTGPQDLPTGCGHRQGYNAKLEPLVSCWNGHTFFFFLVVVLGFEVRASCLLGRCSTNGRVRYKETQH
jgi:hypothetical protein